MNAAPFVLTSPDIADGATIATRFVFMTSAIICEAEA